MNVMLYHRCQKVRDEGSQSCEATHLAPLANRPWFPPTSDGHAVAPGGGRSGRYTVSERSRSSTSVALWAARSGRRAASLLQGDSDSGDATSKPSVLWSRSRVLDGNDPRSRPDGVHDPRWCIYHRSHRTFPGSRVANGNDHLRMARAHTRRIGLASASACRP